FGMSWGPRLNDLPGNDAELASRGGWKNRQSQQHPEQPPSSDQPVRTVDSALQKRICSSRNIRDAMQLVENKAIHDPNGLLLQFLAEAVTGVSMSSGPPKILDSTISRDNGRYTSKVPGSFVCAGLFIAGDVKIETVEDPADADPSSVMTAEGMKKIVGKYRTYQSWFIVKPLEEGNYRLTLLPAPFELSRPYSTDFTFSDRVRPRQ
ncbi:MAG TPA: hypothetical protein VKD91_09365, partial [Pyrinomonadaceae bacterium]|nr:hypothetical protein [Pyrinomonadaceae bacterium]